MKMTPEEQRADLEFFNKVTDLDGPAMTWGIHSIGYKDLLELNAAAVYFNQSFQDNMQQPFLVWSETPTGGAGNFITGAGGFLQTVVHGYPGLRVTDTELMIHSPVCPEGTSGLKLRGLTYKGYRVDLSYSCGVSVVRGLSCAPSMPYQLDLLVTEVNTESGPIEFIQYASDGSVLSASPLNSVGSGVAVTLNCEVMSENRMSLREA
jgi:hypothetical protein